MLANFNALGVIVLLVTLLIGVASGAQLCNQTCKPCAIELPVDFVFLVDTSSSMTPKIKAIANGLEAFALDILKRDIDPNFMIILYGHHPEVILDWTKSAYAAAAVLQEIKAENYNYFQGDSTLQGSNPTLRPEFCPACQYILVHDRHDCTGQMEFPTNANVNPALQRPPYPDPKPVPERLTNYKNLPTGCGTREGAVEPILMSLCEGSAAANPDGYIVEGSTNFLGGGCHMYRHPDSITATKDGKIVWNTGEGGRPSERFFIALTDEDLDCNFWEQNRPDENGVKPACKTAPKPCSGSCQTTIRNEAAGATTGSMEPPYNFNSQIVQAGFTHWGKQIDEVVAGLLKYNASYNMFVDTGSPSNQQYGNPGAAVQNADFSGFDAAATKQNLLTQGLTQSIWYKLLDQKPTGSKASYRVFDVNDLTPAKAVDFFKEVLVAIDQDCTAKKRDAEGVEQEGLCYEWLCDDIIGPTPVCRQVHFCPAPDGCPLTCLIPGPKGSFCVGNGFSRPNSSIDPFDNCQYCNVSLSTNSWSAKPQPCTPTPPPSQAPPPPPSPPTPGSNPGTAVMPPSGLIPTCDDNIWNQGETGVDCGGPCLKTCPLGTGASSGTCTDGVQNQGELDVDCDGPCTNPCDWSTRVKPTCDDMLWNGGEIGVDCGPFCDVACPTGTGTAQSGTCEDGIQQGTELFVDCFDRQKNCPECPKLPGRGGPAILYGGPEPCRAEQFNYCSLACFDSFISHCNCTAAPLTPSVKCSAPDGFSAAGALSDSFALTAVLGVLLLLLHQN